LTLSSLAPRCEERGVDDNAFIRNARTGDGEAITAIYAHHVLSGTASYDYEPPDVDAIRAKLESILGAGWPFLVFDIDGAIAGYAYATQFRDRAAYRFTAENSIYVHPGRTRQGVGKALLEALIARAAECGFRQLIAVIGGAEPASIALHAKCGFAEVGRLSRVGWKKERWLDSVYMQRALGKAAAGSSVASG
jgi:L-amino acid N-acyltransferase YncA